MLTNEQTYPIEKTTALENVWTLTAYQIAILLRAADQDALFTAAANYTTTAENLDRTADTIRRGATDLSNAWRGNAAHDSLNHLRQYYASARSLAADCRTSAAAMKHAAEALAQARTRAAALLLTNTYPSRDPTTPESLEYQTILNDLNTAYRESITMAPDQLAISLPDRGYVDGLINSWKEGGGSTVVPGDVGSGRHGVGAGGIGRPSRLPVILPPVGPPMEPPSKPKRQRERPPITNVPHEPHVDGPEPHSSDVDEPSPWVNTGDPFLPHTALAGSGVAPHMGIPGVMTGGLTPPGGSTAGSTLPLSSHGLGSGVGPGKLGSGTPPGGFVPAGGGSSSDTADRERRFYLTEDPEIWGTAEAVPSVLYGEYQPALHDEDDDDDDW